MNVALLERIAEHVVAHPETLDMGSWITGAYNRVGLPIEDVSACGTVCCIAGWALMVTSVGNTELAEEVEYHIEASNDNSIAALARDALELSEEQARRLFYVIHWPRSCSTELNAAFGVGEEKAIERARVTSERIKRFIQSEGLS